MSQSSSDRADDRAVRATLPESALHRLLASNRRRILLELLEEQPTPVDLEALAILVAKREAEVDSTEPADLDRIEMTLHHEHLPVLAQAGVVDYQPAANSVESYRELVW